jgi:hypothetical protein
MATTDYSARCPSTVRRFRATRDVTSGAGAMGTASIVALRQSCGRYARAQSHTPSRGWRLAAGGWRPGLQTRGARDSHRDALSDRGRSAPWRPRQPTAAGGCRRSHRSSPVVVEPY